MVVIAARIGGEEIPPKPDSKADKTEEFLAAPVQFVIWLSEEKGCSRP